MQTSAVGPSWEGRVGKVIFDNKTNGMVAPSLNGI
jgi:hypothetical protein